MKIGMSTSMKRQQEYIYSKNYLSQGIFVTLNIKNGVVIMFNAIKEKKKN